MKSQFRLAENEAKTALVVVFPPAVKGLFNSEVHELVSEVQELLDGVYVTYALSSGSSPDLRAALSAARFVGCESAVVVPAGAGDADRLVNSDSKGDWLLTVSTGLSELDAPALVDAYRVAVAEAGRAA
ncbi:MAG: CbiX/SirB N-terminal domain-containing protein [Thermoanaerobaculales bacterium]|nr:CbiX/SirB N-terminal domain-containing protein [Thermoanaerobaculales bacterium]